MTCICNLLDVLYENNGNLNWIISFPPRRFLGKDGWSLSRRRKVKVNLIVIHPALTLKLNSPKIKSLPVAIKISTRPPCPPCPAENYPQCTVMGPGQWNCYWRKFMYKTINIIVLCRSGVQHTFIEIAGADAGQRRNGKGTKAMWRTRTLNKCEILKIINFASRESSWDSVQWVTVSCRPIYILKLKGGTARSSVYFILAGN